MDIHNLFLKVGIRDHEKRPIKEITNIKPEELEDIIKEIDGKYDDYYVTLDKSHKDDNEYKNVKVKQKKK